MLIALTTAQRSPDPNTQVGACIVDSANKIIGIGYNAFPRGICQDAFSWEREGNILSKTKYPYVLHAEENAILSAEKIPPGCTLYVTLFPCSHCMRLLIQKEIFCIYYLEDRYANADDTKASKALAKEAKVLHQLYIPGPHIIPALDVIKSTLEIQ